MSGALWVKITTGIWASDCIKLIRKMPDGDTLLVIWFQMLTQAGKCNAGGRLQMTEYIPLDADMLADLFDRPLEVIERALDVFTRFGMIEFDDDCPVLPNWYKYQSEDALEKIREQGKERQQRFRDKRKAARDSNVTDNAKSNVTRNGHKNKNLELERERERDIKPLPAEPAPDPIPYAEIVDYLNEKAGTGYKSTSDKTRKLIRARFGEKFTVADFKRAIDNMVAEWNNPPRPGEKDMRPYLRPETLFGNKFEGYVQRRPPKGGGPQGGGNSGGKQGNTTGADYSAFIEE